MSLSQDNKVKIFLVLLGGLGTLIFFLFKEYWHKEDPCGDIRTEIQLLESELINLDKFKENDSTNTSLIAREIELKANLIDLKNKEQQECLE